MSNYGAAMDWLAELYANTMNIMWVLLRLLRLLRLQHPACICLAGGGCAIQLPSQQ